MNFYVKGFLVFLKRDFGVSLLFLSKIYVMLFELLFDFLYISDGVVFVQGKTPNEISYFPNRNHFMKEFCVSIPITKPIILCSGVPFNILPFRTILGTLIKLKTGLVRKFFKIFAKFLFP